MLAADSPEAWREALDAEAERILARAGVTEPPIDMLHAAKALGFVVAVDQRLSVRARHVHLAPLDKRDDGAAILLRPEPRLERRHWAVAHEIGEHHIHGVFAAMGADAEAASPRAREQTVNALANRLLLPTRWFRADGFECRWDLAALKRRYLSASYELVARRMLEMDAPAIVTMLDQAQLRFRNGNSGGRVPPLMDGEKRLWHTAHCTGQVQECRDPRFWIRVWPIHEGPWKREILRTELAGDGFTEASQDDF